MYQKLILWLPGRLRQPVLGRMLKRRIREYAERQNFEQESYHELQGERLKAIVRHAYENVELYREKYDEVGVKPEDIKSVDDIHKLPVITKEDLVRNFPHGIVAKNIPAANYQVVSTSGSTGMPIKIYKDKGQLAKTYGERDSLAVAIFSLIGTPEKLLQVYTPEGEKRGLMVIIVPDRGSLEQMISQETIRLSTFVPRFFEVLNALDDPREHLSALERLRPDMLFTYPSVLKNMAILAQEEQIRVPQLKLLITAAEVLDSHTRKVISQTFEGELINYYGATEANIIALECTKHEGLHVQCNRVVLEILKDGKPAPPGSPGKVVITDLRNRSTPIIRYSGLGDVAVLSDKECSCGNKFPLLKQIEGRVVDSLILPNKQVIHPYSLTLSLEHVPSIAKFQVIQERMDKVRVLIVPRKNELEEGLFREGEQLWSMVMENFRKLLGEDVHITIEQMEDIPGSLGLHYQPIVRSLVKKAGI